MYSKASYEDCTQKLVILRVEKYEEKYGREISNTRRSVKYTGKLQRRIKEEELKELLV